MNYCNSMTEKQKISCLSHKEDPDGIISAVLIKHLFNAEIHLVDYENILSEIKNISKTKNLQELYICDLAITSNIESEFFSLLENISRQNTSIWYIDHHRLSTDLKNSLEKINVNLVISDQDCTSAIIYERFENNLDRNDSLLTACASITDNLENGIIGRKIINQHEKMFLFLNSSLLWFTIRSNQDNQTKLNTIVDRLSQNKLPYELLDDFSDLKSFLEELHHSILEIEKNLIHYENFDCVEIFDGKFTNVAEKLLATSNKNISLVYKKNSSNLSREIVILSNNKTNKNIGLITNSLCTKFDGAGGGDSKKSAAVIPERNFENFLQELNNSI